MKMVRAFTIGAWALVALVAAAPATAQDPIAEAIDKGIDYLLKEIEKQQVPSKHGLGQVALETYALVVAGVSVDHPLIENNFNAIRKANFNHTYTVSCVIFALDAALSQIEADQYFVSGRQPRNPPGGTKYRVVLDKAVRSLVKIRQRDSGGWNYGPGGNRFDNSNTQFAVLALGVGAKRNVPIPPEVWQAIAQHFVGGQQKNGPEVKHRIELLPADERGEGKRGRVTLVDRGSTSSSGDEEKKERKKERGRTVVVKPVPEVGEFGEEELKVFARGWTYQAGNNATWNMTNAGLSSLILAAESLRGRLPPDSQNALNRAIRDGYGWLMQHWNPFGGGGWKYYGIYSLEKVGDLGDVKKFGEHDWYEEVSKHVVGDQRDDGSWAGDGEMARVNTAFALLVLNRATSLLTQRANRMVVTGPGAHKDDDRENWVYIRSMDREFHLPSLFRMLRLRPSPALAKFVNLVVENYPPERNGRLIPGLVKAYDELTSLKFKRLVMDRLKDITGVEYEDPQKYHVWYRRWKDVDEVGTLVKKEEGNWLLKIYEKTRQSVPLRKKIIWALTRCQISDAAPLFIDDLDHEDPQIREVAYIGLTTMPFAASLPPFDANANARTREEQVAAISDWYRKAK